MALLNTYFVYVRKEKENNPEVRMQHYDWGCDPPEPVWCADVVHAESPAQAKYRFLAHWAGTISSPVYHDDWPLLRVRLLGKSALSENQSWHRIHEILDHDGASCECPTEDEPAMEGELLA